MPSPFWPGDRVETYAFGFPIRGTIEEDDEDLRKAVLVRWDGESQAGYWRIEQLRRLGILELIAEAAKD